MNREDEMLQAAKEQYPDIKYKGTKGMMAAARIKDFTKGVNWADEHPKKGLVDINKVCEWLKSYKQDFPNGTGYVEGIINDKTINDLKNYIKGE